jgi:hypothetical protein
MNHLGWVLSTLGLMTLMAPHTNAAAELVETSVPIAGHGVLRPANIDGNGSSNESASFVDFETHETQPIAQDGNGDSSLIPRCRKGRVCVSYRRSAVPGSLTTFDNDLLPIVSGRATFDGLVSTLTGPSPDTPPLATGATTASYAFAWVLCNKAVFRVLNLGVDIDRSSVWVSNVFIYNGGADSLGAYVESAWKADVGRATAGRCAPLVHLRVFQDERGAQSSRTSLIGLFNSEGTVDFLDSPALLKGTPFGELRRFDIRDYY